MRQEKRSDMWPKLMEEHRGARVCRYRQTPMMNGPMDGGQMIGISLFLSGRVLVSDLAISSVSLHLKMSLGLL